MVYVRWSVALLSPAMILAPAVAQERAPVPGEVDTHVTQATILTTICDHGYTAKVRPPRKFTEAIKNRLVNGLPLPTCPCGCRRAGAAGTESHPDFWG